MTSTARRDPRGNPVSTASGSALDASEPALWRMMSFYDTPIDDLEHAIAADPGWVLPRLMKAGFLLSLTEPSLAGEAEALLISAAADCANALPRERAHLAALQRLAAGDWLGAGAAWSELLRDHPRDALALQWAHLFDFYRGDATMLLERPAGVLPAWPDDDPLRPHALAMHAFGLEESGCYAEAEAAGRRALAADARVPWAIHAVAHVMEMQGRHEEGARWMAEQRSRWDEVDGNGDSGVDRNGLAGHLGWHEALFALEGLDIGAALRVFDRYLDAAHQEITLQRVDAASLLWRIDLLGADVGDRWRALVDGWALDAGAAGRSVFNDTHAALALIGAGERMQARAWLSLSVDSAERRPGWNRDVSREIGTPLMHGLLAYGEGRFAAALDAIAPLRAGLARFGGSHAQRELVDQTLMAAAAQAGSPSLGRIALGERRRAKPATALTRHWQSRLS